MSHRTTTIEPPFQAIASIRRRHVELMAERAELDKMRCEAFGAKVPPELLAPFRERVQDFLEDLVSAGAYLGIAADRADAQSVITFWTSVLQEDDPRPLSLVLDPFEPRSAAELAQTRSPYRGLLSFSEQDSDVFFGRGELVSFLLNRLRSNGSVAVLGVSGSGKSSLVRAGLLPALRADAIPGSAEWKYIGPFVPGADPVEVLRRELAAIGLEDLASIRGASVPPPGDTHLMFVVDQFEELFTLASDRERDEFIGILTVLVSQPGSRCGVILTMRSEYDLQLLESGLGPIIDVARIRVPSMETAELSDAIERPAGMFGVQVEPYVTQDLIRNIQNEPAGLPLLQFALLKLWLYTVIEQGENRVRRAHYEALGGSPQRILARASDEAYQRLIPEQQRRCRLLCLELVAPGDTLEVTSKRRRRSELDFIGPRDEVDQLIRGLVEAGLLKESGTIDNDGASDKLIEFSHESVTRNWPELIRWVKEDLTRLRRRQLLRETVRQFQEHRPGVALYAGEQLREALEFPGTSEEERQFLKASMDAEAASQRAQQIQQGANWASIAMLILAAFAIYYFYDRQRLVAALEETQKKLESQNEKLANLDKANRASFVEVPKDKTEVSPPPTAQVNRPPRIYVFFPCPAQKQDCDDQRLVATLMVSKARQVLPDAVIPKIYAADPAKFTSFGNDTEVRVFRAADLPKGQELATALANVSPTVLRDGIKEVAAGSVKETSPLHFEVWIGRKAKATNAVVQATLPPSKY
jgi:hypothetical protein